MVKTSSKNNSFTVNRLVLTFCVFSTATLVGLPFSVSLAQVQNRGVLFDDSKNVAQLSIRDGVGSQENIDRYDNEKTGLVGEYRVAITQLDALKEYNNQLDKLIIAQKKEVISLRDQIKKVTTIDRSIIPHMFRMIDGLDAFVTLDVPFLIKEREKRVADLRSLMDRSDANPAEKYRKILEAFEIENEYGRTVEAYEGDLFVDGVVRRVNYLRLGRVSWIYQSIDKRDSGAWNNKERKWVDLDGDFDSVLRKNFQIAREQSAPDLLLVPLFGAEKEGK